MAEELRELDTVINIGGKDYNVNAETANKVNHKLKINKVTFSGSTSANPVLEFDGAKEEELEIMPTTGGKFRGHIRVPDAKTEISVDGNKISNFSSTLKDFFDDAVLNYKDIKTKVLDKLLNTSVLYNWDGATLSPTVKTSINGISLITGTELLLLGGKDEETGEVIVGFAEKNSAETGKYISAYLYICTDTHNIYFGTSDSVTVTRLSSSADDAEQLKNSRTFKTDLESESDASFNGTEDVTVGVTGTLPPKHGGTGQTNLSLVTVGQANKLTNARTLSINLANDNSITFDGSDNKVMGTSGVLPIAKGGTGKSDLNSVKVGSAIKTDKVITQYITGNTTNNNANSPSSKEAQITISSIAPTDYNSGNHGDDGDIWIKY